MRERRRWALPTRLVAVAALAAGVVVGATAPPVAADGNEAPGAPRSFRALAGGQGHTCDILDSGGVRCWGRNSNGQLGLGDTVDRGDQPGEMGADLPAVQLGPGRTATAISVRAFHTCALLDNSTVKCWGNGTHGRLGSGGTANLGDGPGEMGEDLPAVALGPGRTVTAISAGQTHTCAILDNATVKCWGLGTLGRLGSGGTANLGDEPGEMGGDLPTLDFGPSRTVVAVSVANAHSCALLDDASVKCWGNGSNGRNGYEDNLVRGDDLGEMGAALPTVDLGPGRTVSALTTGDIHTCARLDDDTLRCWGANNTGQLGLGDASSQGDEPGEMGANLPPVGVTLLSCDGRAVTVDRSRGESPTGGADVILGTPGPDTIFGLGGNDRICARNGSDTVDGGDGADRLDGNAGNDILRGRDGADTLNGNNGADTLEGGNQADTANGGNGNDRGFGQNGNDILNGQAGADTLDGGANNDRLNGGTERDACHGRTGTDRQTSCEVRTGIP